MILELCITPIEERIWPARQSPLLWAMAGGLQHITSSWQQAIKTLMLRNNLNIFIMN